MKLYPCRKTVLKISPNAKTLLHGLTSNTLEAPHNAFVTIHGRIVATFDQLLLDENTCLAAVEDIYVDGLLAHVEKFARLNKAECVRLDWKVYFDLDDEAEDVPETETYGIPQKAGRLILSEKELPADVDEEAFRRFRVKNGIPWPGEDYRDEFILNVGYDWVSMTKGCFLGQEPISKVHNRSRPSRQLQVRAADACTEEERARMTSVVEDPSTGKSQGFLFVSTKAS